MNRFRTLLCALAIMCGMQAGYGQTKVSEPAAGFSYTAPKGWRVATFPGLKYKIVAGTPAQGFMPNINFVDEDAPMSIQEYAKANLTNMQKMFPGFQKLAQSDFTTASGLKGVKLTSLGKQQGKQLRMIFFLFTGKGSTKLVITCTTLASDGAKFDSLFDATMKTFSVK